MKKNLLLSLPNRFLGTILASAAHHLPAPTAGTLFWDTNGPTPGSGNTGGPWDSTSNWSPSPDGDVAPQGWLAGESAVFSAGTDGITAKTVNLSGTIATPSILLEEAGAVTLAGGSIDITGGSQFNTSALGILTGNQLLWTSAITGTGPLTLAAHGSTSDSGDGSNSLLALTGTSSFTGDITVSSGVVRANSNLGPLSNTVILNGGGLVDPNLNLNFPYPIRVDAGQTGIYRTWGSVTTGRASGPILGAGTLVHTDGGTLTLSGDGSNFTGTINNARGSLTLTTPNWNGTRFLNADGTALNFNAPGTTTIASYAGDRDVFIPAGNRLNVASGSIAVVNGTTVNAFVFQPASGGGTLTSSSGTLTLDWDTSFNVQATQSISVPVADFNAATPLTLIKNGPGALSAFNQANTYSGGTTINGGRINAQNASAFGTGKVSVKADPVSTIGGQAWLSLSGASFPNAFDIEGTGPTETAGNLGAIRFENNTTATGPVTVTGNARIVAYSNASGTISGPLSGSSDLEINFASNTLANGTVSLTGPKSAFTGKLIASRGTLNIPSGSVGGSLVVDDPATFSGKPSFAGNVSLGSTSGARLLFDGATTGNLHTAGNLSLIGLTTIVASNLKPGLNTILTYDGSLTGDATNLALSGNLPTARPGTGFDFSQPGKVNLNFAAAPLLWSGNQNNLWDNTALNWLNGTTPDAFYDLDIVSFGENVRPSLITNLPSTNDDLVFTARAAGDAGTAITIEYLTPPASNSPLSVGVSGSAITVSLGIDANGLFISTAANVKTAIDSSPAASALVNATLAPGNDGSGLVAPFGPLNLTPSTTISIAAGLAVAPSSATFDFPSAVGYLLSGPGTLANTPILKKGSGTLTIGDPNDYTQSTAVVTGTTPLVIEKGNLAFSSRTALAANLPLTLGNLNSTTDPTILEVPRAAAGDQVVLTTALTLGTLPPGSTSEAIVRYTGLSNGSTATAGAPSVNGTVNLNRRDLFLENISHLTGGAGRLWNFQPAITGQGNVRVRAGTNPDGSHNGTPRIRIQSTSNAWVGDLYLVSGELQIGFTGQVIPDNALAIFSPGTRLSMGNTGETIRGLRGGEATEALPFTSDIASNTGQSNTVRLTLTDTNAANTHIYGGRLSNGSPGTFALTKNGASTQVLNGPATYTGSTLLNGGRLVINNSFTSPITVAAGATLAGNLSSSAAITATAAAARIAPGDSIGTLSAASANLTTGGILEIQVNASTPAINDKIVTSGVLNITNATLSVSVTGSAPPVIILASYGTRTGSFATTTGIPAGYSLVYDYNDGISSNNIALVGPTDPYLAWLASWPSLTGPNRAPDFDADGDGLANGIEFVLGSNPTSPSSTGTITTTLTGSSFNLAFQRAEAAKSYALSVESGPSPTSWTSSLPIPTTTTAGPPVTVTDNGASPDDITVAIPILPGDSTKFARIKVNIPFTP
jgi:autotransporter-associated beta strand protein